MEKDQLKIFVFTSIISADNDEFAEEVKQEIISRYNPDEKWEDHDWEYILDPIKDTEHYQIYLDLLKS